jgi:hypothetical protein
MEANKLSDKTIHSKLSKVLSATAQARDAEDQVETDREGELLPDPSDEPIEGTAYRTSAHIRRIILGSHRNQVD